jgi:2-polyprenyl-3-methyl-5-hydroxy-6-metoxy-1,4-benzoquinol methylase
MSRNKKNDDFYLESALIPAKTKFLHEAQASQARYKLATQYAQNKVVLDIGCGAGYGSDQLICAGAKKVYGVDYIAHSIVYCQAHHRHRNLFFRQGDITRLDFDDNYFDQICAFEVIEHIKNYREAIGELHRVLKPGGLLIISTPNKAIYSPNSKKPFHPFHYHEWFLDDFKKILIGFKIQKILGQYFKGSKRLLYPKWSPKRLVRIIYANLPSALKKLIYHGYLKTYIWTYRKGISHPKEIRLSDIYYSEDLSKTGAFVAICQKLSKGH